MFLFSPSIAIPTKDRTWFSHVSVFGICLINQYQWLLLSLFVSFTWLVSTSIQVITGEVKDPLQLNHNATRSQILKWKRSYCLILDFTEEINQFFGIFFVISFVKEFILLYLHLFWLSAYWHSNQNTAYSPSCISIFISCVVVMSILIFASQNMRVQVTKAIEFHIMILHWNDRWFNHVTLSFKIGFAFDQWVDHPSSFSSYYWIWCISTQRIKTSTFYIHFQFFLILSIQVYELNELINNISHNHPRISPMDIFEIRTSLIPVVWLFGKLLPAWKLIKESYTTHIQ